MPITKKNYLKKKKKVILRNLKFSEKQTKDTRNLQCQHRIQIGLITSKPKYVILMFLRKKVDI